MSDHIPFDIQSEIMKRLPVKSLIQFRSVSNQWKSFIDDPKFIKNYHKSHTNPQHRLLILYQLGSTVQTYTSIIDNNTFPRQKFPLTAPRQLSLLRNTLVLSSVNGLLCFYGFYGDEDSKTRMAVIWNPTLRKSVGVVVMPKLGYKRTIVGFGVSRDTSDPMLIKISVSSKIDSMWEVDVFTLSTRAWKTVYAGAPFKSCDLMSRQIFVNGLIYFRACDDNYGNDVRYNFIISFDMMSQKFGEVCLPERLIHTPPLNLDVAKVNESLGLLEYYVEGDMRVCGVWTMKDDGKKTFSKIYTVKVEDKSSLLYKVLEFSNNGGVLMELVVDDNYEEPIIEVYEPFSGHSIGVGINGNQGRMFSARSYMETLLLLGVSDSIIH